MIESWEEDLLLAVLIPLFPNLTTFSSKWPPTQYNNYYTHLFDIMNGFGSGVGGTANTSVLPFSGSAVSPGAASKGVLISMFILSVLVVS